MKNLSTTLISESGHIHEVENFIESVMIELDIPQKFQARIALPVIETVTNPFLFGNNKDSGKTVKINATKETDTLIITVEDEGEGVNSDELPDCIKPDEPMEAPHKGVYASINLPDKLTITDEGHKIIMTYFLDR